MLLDPTERKINPLLFQTRIRTVKKLVLASAIHDKNVTMAKTALASFTVRTGLAHPFEDCRAAETHRNTELRIPTLSKQRLTIAVPSYPRCPFPVKVQVRSSWHIPPRHTMASSWVRQPSTVQQAVANTASQFVAR